MLNSILVFQGFSESADNILRPFGRRVDSHEAEGAFRSHSEAVLEPS
jgi:hypothetical protein